MYPDMLVTLNIGHLKFVQTHFYITCRYDDHLVFYIPFNIINP